MFGRRGGVTVPSMTEHDTRNLPALFFAAAAVLVPIGIFAVIAGVGGTPHGSAVGLFAFPAVVLVAALAFGARLTHH